MSSTVSGRQRLLVLGGGPATLTAVYKLMREEPERWDITIYEMSWRLGGKLASGRGRQGRVEEHGLHILFGCYHNLFDLMVDCYGELDRSKRWRGRHRFRTFLEALEPGQFGKLGEEGPNGWSPWNFQFAANFGRPGGAVLPDSKDMVVVLLQVALSIALGDRALRLAQRVARGVRDATRSSRPRRREPLGTAGAAAAAILARIFQRCIRSARRRAPELGQDLARLQRLLHRLAPFVRSPRGKAWNFTRTYAVVDALVAVLRGLVASGVVAGTAGFNELDDTDLRGWLGQYGAEPRTLESPLVHMIYDAAFSCPEGGSDQPALAGDYGPLTERIAAGAALRALLFMAFTYKGAFYYRMRAGTADVLATPLYLVLREKGVKFHFFHRVRALRPELASSGANQIQAVIVERLARCREGAGAYDPLVSVDGCLCWSAEPDLSQIVADDHDNARSAERFFHSAEGAEALTLERGRDFDRVLFGLPVACIPYICHDILDAARRSSDPKLSKWLDQLGIASVQTLGLQLWSKRSLADLGWKDPPPLLSLFRDPLNTYCDMQQLLESAGPNGSVGPKSLAFFCGPLPHVHPLPAAEAFRLGSPPVPGYDAMGAALQEQATDVALKLIERDLTQLWPLAGSGDGFDWDLLHDPEQRQGRARLDAQYMSVNWEPQARCTLALPGQTRLRMAAGETGYDNLVVTGDWIDNGIYVACVEGAVQAGIRAARALSGRPERFPIKAESYLAQAARAVPEVEAPRARGAHERSGVAL